MATGEIWNPGEHASGSRHCQADFDGTMSVYFSASDDTMSVYFSASDDTMSVHVSISDDTISVHVSISSHHPV